MELPNRDKIRRLKEIETLQTLRGSISSEAMASEEIDPRPHKY